LRTSLCNEVGNGEWVMTHPRIELAHFCRLDVFTRFIASSVIPLTRTTIMKKLYTPYLSQQPSQLVRRSLGLIQAHTYNTTSKCMKAFTTVPVAMKNTLLPGWGLDVDHMKATTEHPRQFFGQPALYPTALGAGTSSNEDCG